MYIKWYQFLKMPKKKLEENTSDINNYSFWEIRLEQIFLLFIYFSTIQFLSNECVSLIDKKIFIHIFKSIYRRRKWLTTVPCKSLFLSAWSLLQCCSFLSPTLSGIRRDEFSLPFLPVWLGPQLAKMLITDLFLDLFP